jgi:hypothetical protein
LTHSYVIAHKENRCYNRNKGKWKRQIDPIDVYCTETKTTLGTICRISARDKIAMICTGAANVTSKGIIPRPIGGTFLKHAVNVIVHLRKCSVSHPLAFKATLIKHQYAKLGL